MKGHSQGTMLQPNGQASPSRSGMQAEHTQGPVCEPRLFHVEASNQSSKNKLIATLIAKLLVSTIPSTTGTEIL